MNYFTDNKDLQFIFNSTDLTDIIRMWEKDFDQKELSDYGPCSVDDAVDNYRRVLDVAGDIAARIVAPLSDKLDTEPHRIEQGRVIYSEPLRRCVRALCQADLMGCTISRKYGGLNLPNVIFTMLVEMISQADAGLQNIFGLQGISSIIENFADEDLKATYLPRFAQGTATGAMALTEDEAGSDLQNIKLKAEQEPDGTWRLSGVKRFITNGGAEVLLVLARSEPGTTDGLGLSLFLCEGDETVRVRRVEEKLGIHSSPTCEISFDRTPAFLIGERQRGLVTYVLALLNGARLATAAQSVGIAQAAFNEARPYAHARKQYGRRIEQLPPVAEMLTGMQIAIEGARALTYETARIMDLSLGSSLRLHSGDLDAAEKKTLRKSAKKFERQTMLLTSIAKYYCSEMSSVVTRNAMQVLGGSGYMRDYPVEKYYRDARITSIYEGTSQLQVLGAFRSVLSGTLEKYFEELKVKDPPRQQARLQKKLEGARVLLSQTLEFLNSKKDNMLLDLCSRKIVDMGSEILIGYLFLRQSLASNRKMKMARMFITAMEPRLKMNAQHIKRADKGCIKDYPLIVGPPE